MTMNPYLALHLAITAGLWLLILALAGCASKPVRPPSTPPVDLKPISTQVATITGHSTDARAAIATAQAEAKADGNLVLLRNSLTAADLSLTKQQTALSQARLEIERATVASAASEMEKVDLREQIAQWQAEAEKYEKKYLALTKYRWAILGIFIWLGIKILGSMGAWSPQGRIAKLFIG